MKIKKISFKKKFKSLLKMILAPSMAFLPGNLAFFMMLSIFPLLTIVGLVASLFSLDVNFIINMAKNAFPANISNFIVTFIQGKGFDLHMGFVTIMGFIVASNGTHAITLASNNLYKFKNDNYLKRRIKALFMVILMLLLLIFTLGFVGFGNKIINLLSTYIPNESFVNLIHSLFVILKWPLALFVIYFNLKLIYTIAPDNKIYSKTTTKGALFTMVGWIIVVKIYTTWLTIFNGYDIFYGSLSNIVILMFILYLISFVFVIGIAINVETYEYEKENEE